MIECVEKLLFLNKMAGGQPGMMRYNKPTGVFVISESIGRATGGLRDRYRPNFWANPTEMAEMQLNLYGKCPDFELHEILEIRIMKMSGVPFLNHCPQNSK